MTEAPTLTRCPRCEAAVINDRAALSRTTRDDGAEVYVCDRCGQREGLYGRDPADQIPLSNWPVPVERLLQEERVLIEQFRGSTLTLIRADELTGEDDR